MADAQNPRSEVAREILAPACKAWLENKLDDWTFSRMVDMLIGTSRADQMPPSFISQGTPAAPVAVTPTRTAGKAS